MLRVNFTYSFNLRALLLAGVLASLLPACAPAGNESTANTPSTGSGRPAPQRDLMMAAPASAGFDARRLGRITEAMRDHVDAGLLAGAVTLAAREGRIVHFDSVGYRDIESGAPMRNDTLFRIYSMTKPVTGVALMMLYEEGEFRLSDPVEKYLPELAGLQVYAGEDANGEPILEPADHPMTIRELMSHTGGLSYGLFSQSAVDDMYVEANILDANQTLDEFIAKLGAIPLRQQPGTMWHYSVSVDVQGALVERLSGQRFGEFLEDRLFDPLGMIDTHFYVPEEKVDRFAQVYSYDDNGELIARERFADANFLVEPNFESGGGGLVSTAMDYARFSQMLLNGGELNGVRILAPLTVDLMHRNQLPDAVEGIALGASGTTFGLDFAIIEDPVAAEGYSQGEYYWGGAAGTWFWIDPVEDIIFVGMIQQFGDRLPDVRATSRTLLYSALMEPNGVR
ncbi:MAG: serine hydrolase domain-containing protein [Pseudohongiellaceae bacterium]